MNICVPPFHGAFPRGLGEQRDAHVEHAFPDCVDAAARLGLGGLLSVDHLDPQDPPGQPACLL